MIKELLQVIFPRKELESIPQPKDRDWTDDEINDWISLDERTLSDKIQFGGGLVPMNPHEIRMKHIYKMYDQYDSYAEFRAASISFVGEEVFEEAVEHYDLPRNEEEYKLLFSGD